MAQGDLHVVRGESGGWLIEPEGSGRSLSTHRTQKDAWRAAVAEARSRRVEALLHSRDGRIRERNTYGHDPRRHVG